MISRVTGRRSVGASAWLAVVALAACPSSTTGNVEGLISATPAALDFGVVGPGATGSLSLQLANTGRSALHVSGLVITGPAGDSFSAVGALGLLNAGKSETVTVTMTAPSSGGVFSATLTIDSTATNAPTLAVQLGVQVEAFPPLDAGPTPDAGAPDSGSVDAGAADAGPCPAGQMLCEGVCTDVTTESNCGQCGRACTAAAPSTASCLLGSCVITLALGGPYSPQAVAADSTNVYWTGSGYASNVQPQAVVMKVPIGGGTPVTIATGDSYPAGIAVDPSNAYYTMQFNQGPFYTINSVALDGGSVSTLADNQNSALAIASGAGTVYWTTEELGGGLLSIPAMGGTVATLAWNELSPSRLNVTSSNVVWVDTNANGAVMSLAINGGTVSTIAQSVWPNGVCVDATNVYWTTTPDGDIGVAGNGFVVGQGVTGGSPATLASELNTPGEIVTDGESLYWAEYGEQDLTGAIATLPVAGGAVTTLAAQQGAPAGIAIGGGNVFWVNAGGQHEIMQLELP